MPVNLLTDVWGGLAGVGRGGLGWGGADLLSGRVESGRDGFLG